MFGVICLKATWNGPITHSWGVPLWAQAKSRRTGAGGGTVDPINSDMHICQPLSRFAQPFLLKEIAEVKPWVVPTFSHAGFHRLISNWVLTTRGKTGEGEGSWGGGKNSVICHSLAHNHAACMLFFHSEFLLVYINSRCITLSFLYPLISSSAN